MFDAGLLLLLFSHSVMSNSLQPQGLQYTRLSCPSLPPGACSNSCPSSQWCHPPRIRVFSNESALCVTWPKYWSFSISSSNEHSELISFRIETGLMSLQSKGLSRVLSSFTIWKHQFFGAQHSLLSNSHMRIWLLEKTKALTIWTFVSKVMSAF